MIAEWRDVQLRHLCDFAVIEDFRTEHSRRYKKDTHLKVRKAKRALMKLLVIDEGDDIF